jgi:hypothetical protein
MNIFGVGVLMIRDHALDLRTCPRNIIRGLPAARGDLSLPKSALVIAMKRKRAHLLFEDPRAA